MSTTTDLWGEIIIDPPLNWGEIRESPFYESEYNGNFDNNLCCVLEVMRTEAETDEGTITRYTSDRLVPANDGHGTFYNIADDLKRAVAAFPGHEVRGYFDGEAESWEMGGLFRVRVRDGQVIRIRANLVWPDGEPEHCQETNRRNIAKFGDS